MAYVPVTTLSISYPDFKWGGVANPDEIDINNLEIVTKLNSTIETMNTQFGQAVIPYPDSSVTTPKIANLAVTTAKLADLAVTDAKVSPLGQDKIRQEAGWIKDGLDYVISSVNSTLSNSELAVSTANNAIYVATNANSRSVTASNTANEALNTANTALANSQEAQSDVAQAVIDVNSAVQAAQQAIIVAQSNVGNTEIIHDVFTIINPDNGADGFTYNDNGDVKTGVLTAEGYMQFTLNGQYYVDKNRIEAVINDVLNRGVASGGLIEVGASGTLSNQIILKTPLAVNSEVTFKYFKQLSLGGTHAMSHNVGSTDEYIGMGSTLPETTYAGQIFYKVVSE